MTIPEAATRHYSRMQRLQSRAALQARQAWRAVDTGALSESWEAILRDSALVVGISAIQEYAATAGASYGASSLAAQGTYEPPSAFVNAAGFAGFAADGRSLSGLLYSPVPHTKRLIGGGMEPGLAKRRGGAFLEMVAKTTVADTGRAASGVDIATRAGVGYTRMLNPPSCDRCSILAGRFYRWNAGFLRHPSCFPAGVTVSGPKLDASSRRWYEGELVTLTTATGENLSLTANHPVLTSRGWVPANLLQEGDDVFRSTRPEGATALVVPDHDQVPALVEDVWRAFSVNGLDRVPSTAEDFHGDGQDGEVDIVYADSTLRDRVHASLGEHGVEKFFPGGFEFTQGLQSESLPVLFDGRLTSHSGGSVSGSGLLLPFSGGHGSVANLPGFTHGSALNSSISEPFGDHSTGHSVLLGEGIFASSGLVGGDDLGVRDLPFASRWDAPALPFSVETRDGYASQGRDLVERLVGQVEADRVVKLSRSHFVGHVYSPSSSEGWLSANNLIVSNCDCIHVPAKGADAARSEGLIHDPYEYFQGLPEAEQDRIYGAANAQAIRDGGDIFQVVNSRRGMKPGGLMTTEGTSRRGAFGQSAEAVRTRGRRLTPEAIYQLNGSDRAGALRDLERYGYILPGGQNPTGSIRGLRTAVNPATMTAAQSRLERAERQWQAALDGRNPFGKGPLTPQLRAQAENNYRRWIATNGEVFR